MSTTTTASTPALSASFPLTWHDAPWGRVNSSMVDYGVTDAFGRRVGGVAIVQCCYGGTQFILYVQAARDGQPYGAQGPSVGTYPTLAAAQAAATPERFESAAKRARSKAAKGVGRQWAKPTA